MRQRSRASTVGPGAAEELTGSSADGGGTVRLLDVSMEDVGVPSTTSGSLRPLEFSLPHAAPNTTSDVRTARARASPVVDDRRSPTCGAVLEPLAERVDRWSLVVAEPLFTLLVLVEVEGSLVQGDDVAERHRISCISRPVRQQP